MIQCSDCEHFRATENGAARFTCNPFVNIKEPECLTKWQLLKQETLGQRIDMCVQRLDGLTQRVETMVQAYQAMQRLYERMAPMQEKMFKHMEREIDDIDEADSWKQGYDDEPEDDDYPV